MFWILIQTMREVKFRKRCKFADLHKLPHVMQNNDWKVTPTGTLHQQKSLNALMLNVAEKQNTK